MPPDLMLAKRGRVEDIEDLQRRGSLFDLKIDGIRCVACVEQGTVEMRSRSGEEISVRFPEIKDDLIRQFGQSAGRFVLDGEIAVLDDRGLPSWPLTHKRQARGARAAQTLPAHFHVFDILQAGTLDLRGTAYANRRQILEHELRTTGPTRLLPVLHSPDGMALWGVVTDHQLEGMIAKRPDAPYRGGRSGDWVKIKRTSTVTCLVGGSDPGTGSRAATFGNLHLYLLDEHQTLVPVGKVGSGFSEKELQQVHEAMQHPPLIVEVEYLDVSPDGQLRQPVFQRVRSDVTVTDCTVGQLA